MELLMLSIFTSTMFFQSTNDHQSTSNDWLKQVVPTGLVKMHNDQAIGNIA